MGSIEPAGKGGHAIISAVFTIEFAGPPFLPVPTVRELLALHAGLKDRYPRRRETTAHRIGIAANAQTNEIIQTDVGEAILGGLIFDSLLPDGTTERSITLEETRLSIARTDYGSWHEIWADVRGIFLLMLPIVMEQRPIIALSLSYTDKFQSDCHRSAFETNMVFRDGSNLLVPNAFGVQDLWHSYHGFFEYPDKPQPHRLLNNLRVQTLESKDTETVFAQISIAHTAVPGMERPGGRVQPIKSADEMFGKDGAPGLLDTYMDAMHTRNKELLRDLINDDMCARIKLTSG